MLLCLVHKNCKLKVWNKNDTLHQAEIWKHVKTLGNLCSVNECKCECIVKKKTIWEYFEQFNVTKAI